MARLAREVRVELRLQLNDVLENRIERVRSRGGLVLIPAYPSRRPRVLRRAAGTRATARGQQPLIERLRRGQFHQSAGANPQQAVRDPINEAAVVRSDQERRAGFDQLRFQVLLAIDVDVVGRLVQDQEIRLGQAQPHEQQARPLAT